MEPPANDFKQSDPATPNIVVDFSSNLVAIVCFEAWWLHTRLSTLSKTSYTAVVGASKRRVTPRVPGYLFFFFPSIHAPF